MSTRAKLVHFTFEIPITQIKKDAGIFGVFKVGELIVNGTGRIDPEYPQPPLGAADLAAWVSIKFDTIVYKEVNLLPVFNLPDAKPLLAMITRASENHIHTIINS